MSEDKELYCSEKERWGCFEVVKDGDLITECVDIDTCPASQKKQEAREG